MNILPDTQMKTFYIMSKNNYYLGRHHEFASHLSVSQFRYVGEPLELSDKYITIPFVYYEGRDEAKETYKYIYSYTKYSTRKNGYTSTLLDKQANEMYIDLWLNDINFYRFELEDVKAPEKNTSSKSDKKVKKSIFSK